MAETELRQNNLPITLHRHAVILIAQLLLLNGVGLRLVSLFSNLRNLDAPQLNLTWLWITLVPTFMILMLLGSIYLVLWWRSNTYKIYEKKIEHIEGVFWRRQEVVRFPSLDVLRLRIPLFGRIFGYGSILLKSSETEEKIELRLIPNPKKYLEIIRELLPKAEQF